MNNSTHTHTHTTLRTDIQTQEITKVIPAMKKEVISMYSFMPSIAARLGYENVPWLLRFDPLTYGGYPFFHLQTILFPFLRNVMSSSAFMAYLLFTTMFPLASYVPLL